MPIHEILIACADEPEAHRKKEGDVIAVRPHGWPWGKKELERGLIVLVEDARTSEELSNLLCQPLYEDGRSQAEVDQAENAMLEAGLYNLWSPPEIIAKRKHKIDMPTLRAQAPAIDAAKIRNKALAYQPFLAASRFVANKDDAKGTVEAAESETVFDSKAVMGLLVEKSALKVVEK